MTNRLTICATCAGAGGRAEGAALAERLGQVPGWEVRLHPCLSACAAPCAVAVDAPGKATYLFAGLTAEDASDLAALMDLYAVAPDGWITDARPAGRVRFCLKGRVPA